MLRNILQFLCGAVLVAAGISLCVYEDAVVKTVVAAAANLNKNLKGSFDNSQHGQLGDMLQANRQILSLYIWPGGKQELFTWIPNLERSHVENIQLKFFSVGVALVVLGLLLCFEALSPVFKSKRSNSGSKNISVEQAKAKKAKWRAQQGKQVSSGAYLSKRFVAGEAI